jgi:hypothetical protein
MRTPTWPVASGSLIIGFAVAQGTGVRALGGIVLVAGAGWCAQRWRRSAGTGRTVALVLVYLGAFVGSHLIHEQVGAWGAVLIAASVTGLATWALADAALARSAGATA